MTTKSGLWKTSEGILYTGRNDKHMHEYTRVNKLHQNGK